MTQQPSPTFRQIQCFLEICRDFHFSNAATRLGLTQPPLSRSIKDLEQLIGTQLFDRSSKKVTLTAAGNAFLDEVYQLPLLINRAVDSAQRAGNGEQNILKIGFVGALLGNELLEIFNQYRLKHPDTQLKLFDDSPVNLLRKVAQKEFDCAFLGLKPDKLEPSLGSFVWKEEKLFACLSKSHSLSELKQISLKKLVQQNLVTLSPKSAPTYRNFVEKLFKDLSDPPKIIQQTDQVPALLSMVAAGIGVALLPHSAIGQAASHIVRIPIRSNKAKISNTFIFTNDSDNRSLDSLLHLLKEPR